MKTSEYFVQFTKIIHLLISTITFFILQQNNLIFEENKITNSQDNSIYTLFYLEWIKRFFFIPSVYIYVIQQKYELLIHTRKNSLFHSPKKIFVPHKILAYVKGGWTSLQGAWLPSGHKTRFVWTVLPQALWQLIYSNRWVQRQLDRKKNQLMHYPFLKDFLLHLQNSITFLTVWVEVAI